MICKCPKPRYSNQIESGVLYFVALGKVDGKSMKFKMERGQQRQE